MPVAFADPRWMSMAVKLRIIQNIASDCQDRHRELESAQCNSFRRPHDAWHYSAYFCTLAELERMLAKKGITRSAVKSACGSALSFQPAAEKLIAKAMAPTYYAESRVRAKLAHWNLNGIPGILGRKVLSNFELLSAWCPPRVVAVYLGTIWNGWVTDRRMRSLRVAEGRAMRSCRLQCGWDEDSVEHYGCCRVS